MYCTVLFYIRRSFLQMTYLAISYFTDVYNRIIVQCTLYSMLQIE